MFYVLLTALLLAASFVQAATPTIRVALLREATELRLTGRNFYCFSPTTPESERTRFPKQASFIHYTGAGFVIDGHFIQAPAIDCISGEGILTINDIPTQGHVTLFPDGQRTLSAVVTLPMEQYLIGVLQGEVGENWPTEALRAQAIAARSYAMSIMSARRGKPYDVVTSTRDQVYDARVKIPATIQAAVLDTQGQTLRYNNQTLRAFYHSCCGGSGESLDAVWQDLAPGKSPPPFTPAVAKDPFCRKAPYHRWELKMMDGDLVQSLKSRAPELASAEQISFQMDAQGRMNEVSLGGGKAPVRISGNQLRKTLGYDVLRSTRFKMNRHGHAVTFTGNGFGHGVGLCQWGAKGMAEKGKTVDEILRFYYPGSEIARTY
jgi:stage II sporulation protein D